MGMFGTSNGAVMGAVQAQSEQQFKNVSNLLSLQENHVEEFFQYHGQQFFAALEQLMEDVVARTVSQMLTQLVFVQDSTSGTMKLQSGALAEFERITGLNFDEVVKFKESLVEKVGPKQARANKGLKVGQLIEVSGHSNPLNGLVHIALTTNGNYRHVDSYMRT